MKLGLKAPVPLKGKDRKVKVSTDKAKTDKLREEK